MAEPTMEIDFFQIEKQKASPKLPSTSERVGSSYRRIQNVVSKINPLVLKTVMAAGATPHAKPADGTTSWTVPPSPSCSPSAATLLSPLPILSPASRSALQVHPETTPLTIFYNGTVAAFDVPRDQAEAIIRMASSGLVDDPVKRPGDPSLDDHQAEGDLPIARKKSLQRFLEKRKGRCVQSRTQRPFSNSSLPSSVATYQSMLLQRE